MLDSALGKGRKVSPKTTEEIAPGVRFEVRSGRVVLSGAGVDAAFQKALKAWAFSHAKNRKS